MQPHFWKFLNSYMKVEDWYELTLMKFKFFKEATTIWQNIPVDLQSTWVSPQQSWMPQFLGNSFLGLNYVFKVQI